MTLALLIMAVGGAWAQSTYTVTFAANSNTKTVENVTLPKTFQCSYDNADGELDLILKELYGWTGDKTKTFCDGETTPNSSDENKVVAGNDNGDHYITIDNVFEGTVTITGYYVVNSLVMETPYSLEISIAAAAAAEPTEWDLTSEDGKTWTLAATPAFDVELEVEYETELALSETTDNSAALTEWDGYEADVTVTRTLTAGMWNTLAVPFDISAANFATLQNLLTTLGGSIVVKQLGSSEFDAGTLTLNFTNATSIEAGKPYLVKVSSSVNLATLPATLAALSLANPFAGVTISKTPVPTETTYADFIPTLGLTEVSGDTKEILFVGSGNKLTHPSTLPGNMKGFRGYFKLKGDAVSANGFSLNLGDETTGIHSIDNGQLTIDNSVYDLQGRRVQTSNLNSQTSNLKRGVYIVNGKKVIIK